MKAASSVSPLSVAISLIFLLGGGAWADLRSDYADLQDKHERLLERVHELEIEIRVLGSECAELAS